MTRQCNRHSLSLARILLILLVSLKKYIWFHNNSYISFVQIFSVLVVSTSLLLVPFSGIFFKGAARRLWQVTRSYLLIWARRGKPGVYNFFSAASIVLPPFTLEERVFSDVEFVRAVFVRRRAMQTHRVEIGVKMSMSCQ